jgi:hypothetical protein
MGMRRAVLGRMAPASFDDIVQLVGEIDPSAVRRIEELGATVDEIAEALGLLEQDEIVREPSSPRVAELRAVLAEALPDEPEDDEFQAVM